MITKPKFWRWARLKVDRDNCEEVLHGSRVHIVQEIFVVTDSCEDNLILNILEDLLKAVMTDRSQLKILRIADYQAMERNILSLVPTETLVRGISGIEEVSFFRTRLTTEQLTAIFTQLSRSEDHKLRILDFAGNNLSSVPTETMLTGISGLVEVALSYTRPTTEQLTGIFTRLSTLDDHKLRILHVENNDISSVPPETLVAGVSGLVEVDLSGTNLTTEQLTGIYRMVAERKSSRLRLISINGNNLSSISRDLREGVKLNQSVKLID